ncbi:MAG: hypothetical protein AAGA57_06585 [Planctomycetota bacterium]
MGKTLSRGQSLRRSGVVLITTMAIVLVLTSLLLSTAGRVRSSMHAEAGRAASVEARWIAEGAARAVAATLRREIQAGEAPALADMPVEAGQLGGGLYWIIGRDYETDDRPVFGLVGESSKLNLNRAVAADLLRLPGMDSGLAAAVADWRDPDEDLTEGGAESDYYLAQDPPYRAKNADLETVSELLLIRGFDRQILYGEDRNRNGVLDPNENDGDRSFPPDNADGQLDRGLFDVATTWTRNSVQWVGGRKTHVDDASPEELRNAVAQVVSGARAAQVADAIVNGRRYETLSTAMLASGATVAEARALNYRLVEISRDEPGVVDILTAAPGVIDAIDDLEVGDGERIESARRTVGDDSDLQWVRDTVGPDKFRQLDDDISFGSEQYSADILAVTGDGRAFCRLFVVIDAGLFEGPRIVFVEDLTHHGWPIDPQILADLRAGVSPETFAQRSGLTGRSR